MKTKSNWKARTIYLQKETQIEETGNCQEILKKMMAFGKVYGKYFGFEL